MKKITGQLTDQQGKALDHIAYGVTIEMTTQVRPDAPGGWIGSATIHTSDARFELFTAYDIKVSEAITYRILNGSREIQAGNAVVTNLNTIIALTPEAYNQVIQPSVEGYTTITGRVSLGAAAVVAVPKDPATVVVSVMQRRYPASEELATGSLDRYGRYELKIPNQKIRRPGATCSDKEILPVYVSIKGGGETAVSATVVPENCCATIDVTIDNDKLYSLFITELEYLLNTLDKDAGVKQGDIAGIGTDGPDSDLNALAIVVKQPVGRLYILVGAARVAARTGINLDHAYALVREKGESPDLLAGLDIPEITAIINNSVKLRISGDKSAMLQDTISKLAAEKGNLLGAMRTANNDDLHTVVRSVLNLSEENDIRNFLALNATYEQHDNAEFWSQVLQQMGEVKTAQLKKGMQVLAITGLKPEITAELLYGSREDYSLKRQEPKVLALWPKDKWMGLINILKAQGIPSLVPATVEEAALAAGKDPYEAYSEKLYHTSRDLYATYVIEQELGKDDFAAHFSKPAETRSFLQRNPQFDPRFDNAWDIDPQKEPQGEAIRKDLLPVQNLMRLTGGRPGAVAEMVKQGIKHSGDIAELSLEDFSTSFADLLGGQDVAQVVYKQSVDTALVTAQAKADYHLNGMNNLPDAIDVGLKIEYWGGILSSNPGKSMSPDLKTLFGSLDACGCSECMSMYSPSAYFTDILNFMRKRLKIGTQDSKPFKELLRRRPDLKFIDLTCKNANTPLPYVDLINEQLEILILRRLREDKPADYGTLFIPSSFQTNGTAQDLEAYPEHTIKQIVNGVHSYTNYDQYALVYDKVLNQPDTCYPNSLPFNLPLEEGRTYLKHLGYERFALQQQFRPTDYTSPTVTTGINESNALAEKLGLSRAEATIIAPPAPVTDNWKYYGFSSATIGSTPWYEILCKGETVDGLTVGLETMLDRNRITYEEFLQLLTVTFVNPLLPGQNKRTFEVSAKASIPILPTPSQPPTTYTPAIDTCKLFELELVCNAASVIPATQTFFDKLHRFIRLKRATGWEAQQLDMALRSLGAQDIDAGVLKQVAVVAQLVQQLGTTPEKLSAFWNDISTFRYTRFAGTSQDLLPSVYDTLFRNKAVLNPPDSNFNDPTLITGSYTTLAGTIVAACNIKQEELFQILQFLQVPAANNVTLRVLSRIYAFGQLSKGLGIAIRDLLRMAFLTGLNGATIGNTATTASALLDLMRDFTGDIAQLKSLAFNLEELEYLLAFKDTNKLYISDNAAVRRFYEGLRGELKKLIENTTVLPEDTRNALRNCVLQYFSANVNMDADTTAALLDRILVNTTTALTLPNALVMPEFINALNAQGKPLEILYDNSIPGLLFSELYKAFWLVQKLALVLNRLKLTKDEAEFLLSTYDKLDITNLLQLPVTAITPQQAECRAFFWLNDWLKVKGRFNLQADNFISLLKQSIGVRHDVPTGNGTKDTWKALVLDLTGWSATDLNFLVGDTGAGVNVLKLTYSLTPAANHFKNGRVLLQLADIMASCSRIGLSPEVTYKTLRTDLILSDAQNIRKAAKAKHGEDWYKVARPMQDVLREKQRQALVAYVVKRPDIIVPEPLQPLNGMKWKNENELFAYLLIDVEMQPCMKTSRLKQGINTLQLYMDRLILNLENENGNLANHITISPDMVTQWKTWRKWYRVWEANRKIFLYPENWIEPELRDDKTPFFKELESQLQQDEVKGDMVEEAMRTYLERLDEVGRLEPVTAYHQLEKENGKVTLSIMHVFARTLSQPQRYFYRRLQDGEWTPWEKVDVDIKSDHIVPVIWEKKLYLFWLTFTQKSYKREFSKLELNHWVNKVVQSNQNNGQIMTIPTNTTHGEYRDDERAISWDIKLNWSKYKNGKWLATEICDDVMNVSPTRIRLTTKEMQSYDGSNNPNLKQFFTDMSNNGERSLAELFRDRLYLSTFFLDNIETQPLVLSLVFFSRADEKGAINLVSFKFPEPNARPFAEREWERTEPLILSPIGTRANKMKFVEIPGYDTPTQLNRKLRIEKVATYQDGHFSYFYNWYKTNNVGMLMYNRRDYNMATPPLLLLNRIPYETHGGYRLTKIANAVTATPEDGMVSEVRDYFFFEDEQNTFYVEKVEGSRFDGYATIKEGGMVVTANSSAPAYNPNRRTDLIATIDGLPKMVKGWSGAVSDVQLLGGNAPVAVAKSFVYRFQTFYHAQIGDFLRELNRNGIPGLMRLENQKQTDTLGFGVPSAAANDGWYRPTNLVHKDVPGNNVQFKYSEAYGIYNWELFFHIPMLVAQRLSGNQQFEEAQKWYHYVFNPTSNTDMSGSYSGDKKRFWKFYPFYDASSQPIETLTDLLIKINNGVSEYTKQVTKWEANPFKPHVIARMRKLTYMKNVLMKYLDNLIAWGDQLFRQDTIESINEATQLYILAANILGRKPSVLPPRANADPKDFDQLVTYGLDDLSNAMVDIESFFTPNFTPAPVGTNSGGAPIYGKMFYFCLPKNDKLFGYWDTVADRLFKIRNCMNIEGTARQLPLYEPPIDPALLVKAAAMGIDTASIVDAATNVRLPYYRFGYTLQKANEFCNDVKSLGSSLLMAIEKKDAEQLALIRSGQELQMLDKVRFIKESQVTDAEASLESLRLTRENTQMRQTYYSTRPFTNSGEQEQLQSIQAGVVLQGVQGALEGTVGTVASIPTIHMQGISSGGSTGGLNYANVLRAASAAIGIAAAINNAKGSMAGMMGGYDRRSDDWNFQADTASKELEQLDQQILAAEMRLDIARRELANHELQTTQSTEVDTYMRSKFSNQELYSWMSSQIATTYFQSYQLAYDLAKKAEKCYRNELPMAKQPVGGFIKFGYWDSLRKGLMSGEKLQFDLRKMEATYMEENLREMELTKSISLALTDPAALLSLRKGGSCTISMPEELFDLDYPGHYLRRIKSVSISLPCIAGPYTTVAATLKLQSSALRSSDNSEDTAQPEVYDVQPFIATSNGQNDSGVFELNFRDERYLPFEGRGAVDTKWLLTLADPEQVRLFDFETISDVIVHLRYTAREGRDIPGTDGKTLKQKRIENVNAILAGAGTTLLPRYFSVKHEFSNEWYNAFQSLVPIGNLGAIGRSVTLPLLRGHFPEFCKDKSFAVSGTDFVVRPKPGISYKLVYNGTIIDLDTATGDYVATPVTFAADDSSKQFSFILYKVVGGTAKALDEEDLSDLFMILRYKLGA